MKLVFCFLFCDIMLRFLKGRVGVLKTMDGLSIRWDCIPFVWGLFLY